jgi:hypothetical protein
MRDPHGIDLANDVARRYEERLAQSLAPRSGRIRLLVDVVDEDGNVLATCEVH